MTTIKLGEVSDVAIISFLGKKTFAETFSHLFDADELNDYLDHTFNVPKLEKSLSKSRNIYGILYRSDNPAGYFKLKKGLDYNNETNEAFIQLQKIYLLHDFLDLNLGNIMLDHILHLKEISDCKVIWLVVLNTNSRAIHFYQNHGFEKINNYFHTIGSKQLEYDLMTKNIKKPPFIDEGFKI